MLSLVANAKNIFIFVAMNLSLLLARRYLFAKKSTNAINLISGISAMGMAVGTAALILVLSVFNGFEELITGLSGSFNPDIKITAVKGKTFLADSVLINNLKKINGVQAVSQTLEEVAFFEYDKSQDFGTIKGVDDNFTNVVRLDSAVGQGIYKTKDGDGRAMAVLGLGMRNKLSVDIDDYFTPIGVYMPKREDAGALQTQFTKQFCYPVGVFSIQQDYDYQYVVTDLKVVRTLLGSDDAEVSALELRVAKNASAKFVAQQIRTSLGANFLVKDRMQQDEATLRITNIEKWLAFVILGFVLLLVAFNLVGSLWMVVIDKRADIVILQAMGATDRVVRRVFLYQGLLLCGLGMTLGFVLALVIYFLQKTFGIVSIAPGFIVDAYPISLRGTDFVAVASLLVVIGIAAAWLPSLQSIQSEKIK